MSTIEAEARRIIEQITQESINPSLSLGEVLKDGVLLCKLLRILKAESVGAFYLSPTTPSQQLNNCKQALKAMTRGFNIKCAFSAKEIRDGTHGGKIAKCIVLLGRLWGGNARRLPLKLKMIEVEKKMGELDIHNDITSNNKTESYRLLELERVHSTRQERDTGKLKGTWSLLDLRIQSPWKRVRADPPQADPQHAVSLLNLNAHRMRTPHDRWREALKRRSLQGVVMVGAYRRMQWQVADKRALVRSFSDHNVSLSNSRPLSIHIWELSYSGREQIIRSAQNSNFSIVILSGRSSFYLPCL
jgi:hypothetical protein